MTIDDHTLKRVPRNSGRDADGEARTELDHFGNCPRCGALVDMRDLRQVIEHVHGSMGRHRRGDGANAKAEGQLAVRWPARVLSTAGFPVAFRPWQTRSKPLAKCKT